jgi:hypothetical protein
MSLCLELGARSALLITRECTTMQRRASEYAAQHGGDRSQ